MKVLILTGQFGMGHVSAAKALKEEIDDEFCANVEIQDVVEYMYPITGRYIYRFFNLMSNKFCGVYNAVNRIDDKRSTVHMRQRLIKK